MRLISQRLAVIIIFLLPLYYLRFSIGPIPTNLIEILIAALLVLTVLSERRLVMPNWQPIALILIGLIVASLVAVDTRIALGIIKGWFVLPLAYYASASTLFSLDERSKFIAPALASVVLVSLYATLQWLGVIPLLAHQGPAAQQYLDQSRALGFFESPNLLALFLVPLTLLVGGYLWQAKRYRPLGWLVLPIIAIGLSQSLGGMLALVAGAMWLWWASAGRPRPGLALGLAGLLTFGGLFFLTDNASRLLIWQKALVIIGQHPIIGIGPGQFQTYFAQLNDGSSLFAATSAYALHPHNIFLNFWLSAGLLGLGGFIWLLVRLFKQAGQSPLALAALAGLVAIVVHGLVDSAYFKNDLAIIFWLLVFLAGSEYGEQNV